MREFSDYVLPDQALANGEIDANLMQHTAYLEKFAADNDLNISKVIAVPTAGAGIFSDSIKSLKELKKGDKIGIPNDPSNLARALSILGKEKVIVLKKGIDQTKATEKDIAQNPKNLKFTEIKPELLGTTFQNGEGDLVAINGNYALQAGLNPMNDALIIEEVDASNPYVNIVAVQEGHEKDEKIQALIEVLKSDEIKQFVEDEYKGAVVMVD